MVSVPYSELTQGIFSYGSLDVVLMSAPTGHLFTLSITGSNPDIDGTVNIWIDANGLVNIKNRLGSLRVITVMILA